MAIGLVAYGPALAGGVDWYRVLGVCISVTSDVPEARARVLDTYAAFRGAPDASRAALALELWREPGGAGYLVRGGAVGERLWPSQHDAIVDLLGRIVAGIVAGLHAGGVDVIHAGAVVHRGRALIVAGPSGHGKTTLTLGLVARGLGLLSDELAVIDRDGTAIAPYRRSVHIRPGTRALLPQLAFLDARPRHAIGGGIEWALTQGELARELGARLAGPAPLGHVLLLDAPPAPDAPGALVPAPSALAAIALMRGTWGAGVDFDACLQRIGRLLAGVRCARLRAGALEPTLDRIVAWLGQGDG